MIDTIHTSALDRNSTTDFVFPKYSTPATTSLCERELRIPPIFTMVGGEGLTNYVKRDKENETKNRLNTVSILKELENIKMHL